MPENVFWHLNPRRLEPWQRHFEFQEQLRRDEEDYIAWLNGQYVLAAVAAAFGGKKYQYPTEPFTLTQRRDEEEDARQIAADRFAAFAMAFNEGFKKRQEEQQKS